MASTWARLKVKLSSPLVRLCVAVICCGIVSLLWWRANRPTRWGEYGQVEWFVQSTVEPSEVLRWSEAERDEKLHGLSRWGLSAQQWREFVGHSVKGLDLPSDKAAQFRYAEIGAGVGAFSRTLLKDYPNARVMAVDLVPEAVAIARLVLPPERAEVCVADATSLIQLPSTAFSYVIVPGVLCYLKEQPFIMAALREAVRISEDGAKVVFTMLPDTEGGRGSCATLVPRDFWSTKEVQALGLRVLSFSNMWEWECCAHHGQERYAVFLRVDKKTTGALRAQTV